MMKLYDPRLIGEIRTLPVFAKNLSTDCSPKIGFQNWLSVRIVSARQSRETCQDTFQLMKARNQMTYKEFKRHVFAIYNEVFNGADNSPIEYGIQRARFEEKKLQRLIMLANQTDFSTAKRKVAGWHRQLERVQQIRGRLELRKNEMLPIVPTTSDRVDRTAPIPLAQNRRARPLLRAQ